MAPRARAIGREDKPGQPTTTMHAVELPAEPDPADVLAATVRMLARLVVHVSGLNTRTSASFRQIVVQELRIATESDVDLIEAWLSNHPS
jgi:hypothetical protein